MKEGGFDEQFDLWASNQVYPPLPTMPHCTIIVMRALYSELHSWTLYYQLYLDLKPTLGTVWAIRVPTWMHHILVSEMFPNI